MAAWTRTQPLAKKTWKSGSCDEGDDEEEKTQGEEEGIGKGIGGPDQQLAVRRRPLELTHRLLSVPEAEHSDLVRAEHHQRAARRRHQRLQEADRSEDAKGSYSLIAEMESVEGGTGIEEEEEIAEVDDSGNGDDWGFKSRAPWGDYKGTKSILQKIRAPYHLSSPDLLSLPLVSLFPGATPLSLSLLFPLLPSPPSCDTCLSPPPHGVKLEWPPPPPPPPLPFFSPPRALAFAAQVTEPRALQPRYDCAWLSSMFC